MPRSALPQNYEKDNGTQLLSFDSAVGMEAFSATLSTNTDYVEGSGSVKVTGTYEGYSGVGGTINSALFNNAQVYRVWVRLETTIANVNEVYLELSSRSDYATRMRASFTANVWLKQNEWVELVCHREDFVSVGGEAWTNSMIRARVRFAPHGGGTPVGSIDSLRYNVIGLPRLVVSFDDNHENDIGSGDTAYSYMLDRNIPGTLYTIPTILNTTNYMTLADVAAYYDLGWAVGGHDSYLNWSDGQTQAYYEAALQLVLNYFDTYGLTRDKYHYAYPAGVSNSNAIAALQAKNFVTGRGITSMYQGNPTQGMFNLKNRVVYDTTSLATVQGWVNDAILYGITLHISFHRIIAVEAESTDWTITKFKALIDWLVTQIPAIKPITITEWYEGLTDPRYRALSVARTEA